MGIKILSKTNNIFNVYCLRKPAARALICSKRNKSNTIDSADVKHHSQLMKFWWEIDGPMRPLHAMNHFRIPFIRDGLVQSSDQNISTCLEGLKILDVGCGGGILSEGLAGLGAEVTGIDASKELIECAQNHSYQNKDLERNRPTYCYSTIEDHAATNKEKYDAVVASEIIEHVNEKDLFVESCVRVTKPNGKLFFTTPSRTLIGGLIFIHLFENIGFMPKGTHQYNKFMTPDELKCMLEKNGCSTELSRGFAYRPLKNKCQWTKTKTFMFAIQAVKK